jgi:MoaA/NifB/PqqE/SkfB family radical SAM enzyme
MTNGSIYYHFLEARRRTPAGNDDFTAWLREEENRNAKYIRALESIDFYFHSLRNLKEELVSALAGVGEI